MARDCSRRTNANIVIPTGRSYGSNTPLARKSRKPLQRPWAKRSTRTSWTTSSPSCSRRSWTTRCWRRARSLFRTRFRDYRRVPKERVSGLISFLVWRLYWLTLDSQSLARSRPKRRTRKRSYGSFKPRWPCNSGLSQAQSHGLLCVAPTEAALSPSLLPPAWPVQPNWLFFASRLHCSVTGVRVHAFFFFFFLL